MHGIATHGGGYILELMCAAIPVLSRYSTSDARVPGHPPGTSEERDCTVLAFASRLQPSELEASMHHVQTQDVQNERVAVCPHVRYL